MAIECNELVTSRQVSTGTSNRARMLWMVDGTDDEIAARNSLLATAPAAYDPYGLGTTSWPMNGLEVETQDADHWTFTVTYEPQTRGGSSNEYSFDTTGGSTHITYNRGVFAKGPQDGRPLTDFKGGINVTKDGPEGVDIVTAQFQWQQTLVISNATVDDTFKNNIRNLTGSVNSATFKGLAAGECLFLGAAGSKTGSLGNWTITYKFASQPNRTNVVINGFATVPTVRGWDYLWVYLEEQVDTTSQKLILRPYEYEIAIVYPYADLNGLGV